MSFVQVIEYQTSDLDAVKRVNDEWKRATEGKRTAKRIEQTPDESVYLDDLEHRAEALSRVFDRSWARSLLREAVERHRIASADAGPEAARRFRILRLRHDDELPIRAITEELGESDTARVHNDYRRARREFAGHLRAVVATHTGATGESIDAECRRLTGLVGS